MKIPESRKKIWAGFLTAVLFLVICCLPVGAKSKSTNKSTSSKGSNSTTSGSLTSESIKEKENQIAQMQKEQKDLKSNLTDLQKVKKDLETQKSNLKNYVAQLDEKLAEIEENISRLNAQILIKEECITLTEEELAEAVETEQDQQESMICRIRLMYERGNGQVLETLFAGADFSDFLDRADYIEMVMDADRRMYEEYKTNRQLIELCKEELELEKAILDQAKVNVSTEQANLEDLIEEKNQDITKYETDISNKSKAIAEYEQMIKDQDAEIAALEAAIAAEKKKILESSGSVLTYDGGIFKFPLEKYTRVSDDYGMRIHPTLGVEQFHNGVDFAAPKGTAIYAAYDGKVVAADYSSTMGNYVMINHGDELYTIYMHASKLCTKKDAIVVRGEKIAEVGTTGRSTGNHLHFSVRRKGAYESPWKYLSQ